MFYELHMEGKMSLLGAYATACNEASRFLDYEDVDVSEFLLDKERLESLIVIATMTSNGWKLGIDSQSGKTVWV